MSRDPFSCIVLFAIPSLISLLLLLLLLCQSKASTHQKQFHQQQQYSTRTKVNVSDLFHQNHSTNNTIASSHDCHVFDGIGGISGGGATSRLLVDYPPRVRSEILDFLFQPNFGAAIQILKVEIGSDVQSTDGSEATHMRRGCAGGGAQIDDEDLNFQRGYEWWLMKEAKKRNPNIRIYGLPWAWPGWITDDTNNPFQYLDKVTNYTFQWVKGARDVHNIKIDYLGIWNEVGTNRDYLLELRKLLNANGFEHIKIVSNDGQPGDIVPQLINDTVYRYSIDILGFH